MGFPVVGVIGGGQLARMMAGPAIELGITLRVLARDGGDSAAQVVPGTEIGNETDLDALRRFAKGCDVVTFDHEHVPTEHLRALAEAGVVVRPGPDALIHAQDKSVMRARLTELAVPCPRWRMVQDTAALATFGDEWAGRSSSRHHGVATTARACTSCRAAEEAADWLARGDPLLAEERVNFTRELAVVVARSPHGQAAVYPVVETVQVDGICREVLAPAAITEEHALAAQQAALASRKGSTSRASWRWRCSTRRAASRQRARHATAQQRPLEIEGARTSQFEQHLRAVLDLPLGDTRMTAPHVAMSNVLGGDIAEMYSGYLHCMAHDPGVRIHMYGKDVRPGRKVGHVTTVGDHAEDVRTRAVHAAAFLRGDIDG